MATRSSPFHEVIGNSPSRNSLSGEGLWQDLCDWCTVDCPQGVIAGKRVFLHNDKMLSSKDGYDAHLFVCTHHRESGEACAQRGSEALRAAIKKAAANPAIQALGRLRINASGCLGHCEKGIAAVLYPEGKWFLGCEPSDAELLLKEVQSALEAGTRDSARGGGET